MRAARGLRGAGGRAGRSEGPWPAPGFPQSRGPALWARSRGCRIHLWWKKVWAITGS